MGSEEVWNLKAGEGFSFIGATCGGMATNERKAKATDGKAVSV